MALPASGPISLSDVNVELGLSATAQISLNDAAVRTLFGVAGGVINMSDGFGKANEFAFTISANTSGSLATAATNAGWNGSSKVIATVASNVYFLNMSVGSFSNGIEIINNGNIVGTGGAGGFGQATTAGGLPGGAGSAAITLSQNVTITNNGFIAGGGGGGGGAGRVTSDGTGTGGGGGGAGGGAGGGINFAAGGAGGTPTSPTGSNGVKNGNAQSSGGGGGFVLPGTGGAGEGLGGVARGGGAGGAGGPGIGSSSPTGAGGGGGGWGASGGAGRRNNFGGGSSGSGGSANNAGATASVGGNGAATAGAGGAGGRAVNLNGNTATFLVTGTQFGAIA